MGHDKPKVERVCSTYRSIGYRPAMRPPESTAEEKTGIPESPIINEEI